MAKNSRLVAQEQTRLRIKQVAREMMLTDGYTATSIAQITATSGYTSGAFYSNFANKAELGMEILRELQDEAATSITEILADGTDPTTRLPRLESWIEDTLDSGWPRIELEFALTSRDDDAIVAAEGDRNRNAVDRIATDLQQIVPRGFVDERAARLLAELVLDLAFGLAVRKIIAPEVSSHYLFELVARLSAIGVGEIPSPTPE